MIKSLFSYLLAYDGNKKLTLWKVFRVLKNTPIHFFRTFLGRWENYFARRKLILLGFSEEVDAIEKRYIEQPIYGEKWAEIYSLVKLLIKRSSNQILEFGSGRTTIIFGAIAPTVSIEASKTWAKINNNYLKKKNKAKIIHSKLSIKNIDNEPIIFHQNLPKISPDFIYIDGPGVDTAPPGCYVAGDVISMNLKPGTLIVVDGRKQNVRFLKKKLNARYFKLTGILGGNYTQRCFEIY